MNQIEHDPLEENTRRLLQAALGSDARPRPTIRSQILLMLVEGLRGQGAAFPDAALVVLGGLLTLAAAGWIGSGLLLESLTPALASRKFLLVILALNSIMMPFAGFVIILRRRSHVR